MTIEKYLIKHLTTDQEVLGLNPNAVTPLLAQVFGASVPVPQLAHVFRPLTVKFKTYMRTYKYDRTTATKHSFPELQNIFSASCIFALLSIQTRIKYPNQKLFNPYEKNGALRPISVTPFYESLLQRRFFLSPNWRKCLAQVFPALIPNFYNVMVNGITCAVLVLPVCNRGS